METAAADEDFSGDVVGERGAEEEDGSGGFFGRAEPAEGAALFERFEGGGGDTDFYVLAVHLKGGR